MKENIYYANFDENTEIFIIEKVDCIVSSTSYMCNGKIECDALYKLDGGKDAIVKPQDLHKIFFDYDSASEFVSAMNSL